MASEAKICSVLHKAKPTLIMILVQVILGIVNIGYKLAANDGMRLPVLVAYRFMFAAAFIVPVAFFVEREKRPKLTKMIVFQGFLCGLFGGSLGQNLYLKSLSLTSATFVSAMANLVPAITFIIAVCLRLEKLGWKSEAGKAKVFGTIIGIGGAMLLTFYKGPELNIWSSNVNLLEITRTHPQDKGHTPNHQGGSDFVLGAILGIVSCVCYSLWLIIQAKCAVKYPCPYSITAMMTFWASIQGTLFAVCTEKDWSNWILGWDIRLLTVAFAVGLEIGHFHASLKGIVFVPLDLCHVGILGSGVMFTLMAWCVKMRGPLFVSIFNPLMLVIVAVAGSLVMEEKLHLGMVLGAILIVVGLYVVLWGKGKEAKKMSQLMPENQLPIEMPPPPLPLTKSDSNHGGRSIKEAEEERDEDRRDSHASSEVLGAFYIVP